MTGAGDDDDVDGAFGAWLDLDSTLGVNDTSAAEDDPQPMMCVCVYACVCMCVSAW